MLSEPPYGSVPVRAAFRQYVPARGFSITPWLAVLWIQIAVWMAAAQTPTPDDFSPGVDGEVFALAVQADGRILVGGSFTAVGGQPRTNAARLNPDGTLDSGFDPRPGGPVYALVVQEDGKILIGGSYSRVAGRERNNLARLNSDGTLDTGIFRAGGGTDGEVRALAVQADGKIVVGGNFSSLSGPWCGRLNPDGTVETVFGYSMNPIGVSAVVVQPDGKILMGGTFSTQIDGYSRDRIARWNADGRLDEAFNPGEFSHNSASVDALAVQADGKILVGGTFTNMAGHTCYRIARLYASGAFDSNFNLGANDKVNAFAVQADGAIVVAGSFTSMSGQPRNRLARFNPDGTLDNDFNPGPNGAVNALALQADGKLLAAGSFTNLAGQPRTNLARLNSTSPAVQSLSRGASDITWLRGGTSPEVWRTTFEHSTNGAAWASLGAGSRIAGGWQITAASPPSNATIRARGFVSGGLGNGSGWAVEEYFGKPLVLSQPANQTLNAGTTATFSVRTGGSKPVFLQWCRNGVALADDSKLGGTQTATLTVGDVQKADEGGYSIVLSNSFGSATSTVAVLTVLNPGIASQPASLNRELGQNATFSVTPVGSAPFTFQWWKDGAPLPQGTHPELTLTNLLVTDAGSYRVVVSNALGCITSSVALLTVNAVSGDDGFDAGTGVSTVYSMAEQADRKLLVGGGSLARLSADGRADSTFNAVASDWVLSLAMQPDGKTLVGGSFTTLGGMTRNYLGRVNPDGTLDSDFNPGAGGWVLSLCLQEDGKILVGGDFATMGGATRSCIGRLNPGGTVDDTFNPGADNTVSTMLVQPDGKVVVGGYFTTLGGQPRTNLARLNPDGTLDTAFNPGVTSEEWYSRVSSLALQADGKILVGGTFSSLGGQPRANLARLNADGTLDLGFDPQVSLESNWQTPEVRSLAVQADGRILVAGAFTMLAGQPRRDVGRLNADGTLDLTFNPVAAGELIHDPVSIMVQADGKILAGGAFTALGGQARTNLARLNNTGPATENLSRDDTAITWLRGGSSPEIWRATFEYTANGIDWTNLGAGLRIAGGWRLAAAHLPPGGTVRARGFLAAGYKSASSWFVETLLGAPSFTTQPLSQTVNAGSAATFSAGAAGPQPLSYQWLKAGVPLTDGAGISGATNFTLVLTNVLKADEGDYRLRVTNLGGSATSVVATLTVIDPVILGSPFSRFAQLGQSATFSVTAAGTALRYQWWKDGVAVPEGTGASLTLTNLQLSDAGKYRVVVSNPFGSLTSAVATLAVNLATVDSGFNPGANDIVLALAVQADKKIVAGGVFTSLLPDGVSQSRNRIARLNADGSLDSGFSPQANATVYSLAIQPDGKILVGGDFTTLGGSSRTYIGRVNSNGTLDPGFNTSLFYVPPDYTISARVQAILVQSDGKVVIGGYSSLNGRSPVGFVSRLGTNGASESAFSSAGGANTRVECLALQPDGKVLVGGRFGTLRGQTRARIGRLNPDGTLDPGFSPAVDPSNYSSLVLSLAVQSDGKILLGGCFNNVAGQPRTNLARLYPDGTLDLDFAPTVTGGSYPSVYSLVVQTDGRILVGGSFSTVTGQLCANLARLNPDGTLDTGFKPGPNNDVYGLALQADGAVLVGGQFGTLSGQARCRIGRLNPTDPATQSLTDDGSTISWLRGGSSPEVWRTTFEASSNRTNWTLLGAGTQIAGGWELAGASLPPDGWIRARGYTSGGGFNASTWFTETISGPCFFISQPVGQTNNAGTNVALAVSAGGSMPLGYQWLKNGTPVLDGGHVAGAQTPVLRLGSVLGADSGGYAVVVSNAFGSITSAVATLKVIEPDIPKILTDDGCLGFRANRYGFTVRAASGQGIDIEASTNLADWTNLATISVVTNLLYFSDPDSANGPRRFYRVRVR